MYFHLPTASSTERTIHTPAPMTYVPVAINSRIETEEVLGPLPDNWEKAPWGKTGRYFFVDHNSQTTTWVDPRTFHLRKHDIREIVAGELPYAWEEAHDKTVGVYYIDHSTQTHYLDAPWEDHVRDQVAEIENEGMGSVELALQMEREKEMKEELDVAQANLEQLIQEKERLESELAELQNEKEQTEDGDELANLEENEAQLTVDLERINERIEEDQAEVDRVAEEFSRLQQEIEEFQNRLTELKDVNDRLEQENKEFMQDATEANTNTEELRNMIEMEAAQRNALESYIKQLKSEVLQLYDPENAPEEEELKDHIIMDAPLPESGTMDPEQEHLQLQSRLENERLERERLREITENLEAERVKIQEEAQVCCKLHQEVYTFKLG